MDSLTTTRLSQIRISTTKIIWGIFVILMPITSMPLMVMLVKSDTVAAPSGLMLFFLIFVWFIPHLINGGNLPRITTPIILFFFSCLLSSIYSYILTIPPFKEINFLTHNIQATITLAIGLCFYFVTTTWVSTANKLDNTYKLINISGLMILLWSILQAAVWHFYQAYPQWMETIQRSLVTGVLFKQRVSGFTLEPSWLAHQLNMLFLPYWLAATIKKYSAFHKKIWIFSIENFLLVLGITVLWLTYSRVGLLAFIFMLAIPIIVVNKNFSQHLQVFLLRMLQRFGLIDFAREKNFKITQIFTTIFTIMFMGSIYISLFIGIAYGLSKFDPRMERVFDFKIYQDNTVQRYAHRLDFGPRLSYWMAGWAIFDEYPVMGVGLGNAGYFFPQMLTPYAWNMMEVNEMMYRSTGLTNIKCLWIRILAEAGIVGFALFLTWIGLIWFKAIHMVKNSNPVIACAGLAGLFVILGLIFEGFSIDSFALPYLWFSLGLASSSFQSNRESDLCTRKTV